LLAFSGKGNNNLLYLASICISITSLASTIIDITLFSTLFSFALILHSSVATGFESMLYTLHVVFFLAIRTEYVPTPPNILVITSLSLTIFATLNLSVDSLGEK